MSEQTSPYQAIFTNADPAPSHALDTFDDELELAPEHAGFTLPRLRSKLLEALHREDFRTIQQHLPHYQELLERAVHCESLTAERIARLEAEHHRFHEQLRATLLTTRISLRLDIERVKGARQYVADGSSKDGIDVCG